jgi:hypothetical protein
MVELYLHSLIRLHCVVLKELSTGQLYLLLRPIHVYIVTDLINSLPGNIPVNTAQHATIGEAVFSMSSAPSSGGTTGLCNPFLSSGSVTHFRVSGDASNNRAVFSVESVQRANKRSECKSKFSSGQSLVSRKLEE